MLRYTKFFQSLDIGRLSWVVLQAIQTAFGVTVQPRPTHAACQARLAQSSKTALSLNASSVFKGAPPRFLRAIARAAGARIAREQSTLFTDGAG
ncbi:hypothetical protein MTO96_021726 [Rhipicephalus appendiculatus]